jgi:hypothetical protein
LMYFSTVAALTAPIEAAKNDDDHRVGWHHTAVRLAELLGRAERPQRPARRTAAAPVSHHVGPSHRSLLLPGRRIRTDVG